MYVPLGSSEVGLLGNKFQSPCGISIHNFLTQGRNSDARLPDVPFPQGDGLITVKLRVSSGGVSVLICTTIAVR